MHDTPDESPQVEPFDVGVTTLRYLDGLIDAGELAQLHNALESDGVSRETFVRFCVYKCQLREVFAAGESEIKEFEFAAALAELAEQASRSRQISPAVIQPHVPPAKSPSAPQPVFPPHWRTYGIAAAILIGVSVAATLFIRNHVDQGSVPQPRGIASIASTLDARWDGLPPSADIPLPEAEMRLASGFAILHFDNGAKVVVEGPADFTPQLNGMMLSAGSLTALVPPLAKGFTVQTGSATIVDLGTEFGVRIGENGETNLQVFKGRVSLKALADSQAAELVTENSARQVHGGATATIPFEASTMVRLEQVDRWIAAQNASPPDRWKAWSERNRRDPDMIAYYAFENAGYPLDRLANLASTGNVLDGTLVGAEALPTWTHGRWEKKGALQFYRGTSQYVTLASGHGTDPLDFSRGSEVAGPFTIAVWVKAAPSQPFGAALISRGRCFWEQFTIDLFGGHFRTFIRESGGVATQGAEGVGSNVGPNGQWQYIVSAYDPVKGVLCLYIDGVLIGENKSAPHVLITGGTPVTIGSRLGLQDTFDQTFDGSIDEAAIWGRTLSPEQIRANYDAGKPD